MTHPSHESSDSTEPSSERPSVPVTHRTRGHRQLLTGSVVLVLGAGVQAIGGSVFWLIAARMHDKSFVGTATALFTSVNFVTYVAGLGLPVALARYAMDRSDESDAMFSWSAVFTVVGATVVGAGFLGFLAVVQPPSTEPLFAASAWWQVSFVVAIIGAALSLIFDTRCMSLRLWHLVLVRMAFIAIIRVPLIFWIDPSQQTGLWLFVFAAAPVASTGLVGVASIGRISGGSFRFRPRPTNPRAVARFAAVNYISTIGYQAPYFALPIIVLAHVNADTNAAFYVAWGVVSVACYVPYVIGQALLAEGGKDGVALRAQLRTALIFAVGIMAVGSLATFLGSGLIAVVYGEQYRDAGNLLPEMMLAGVPWAISSIYLTEARVLHRNGWTVAITSALMLAIIVPALILVPSHGMNGAAHAWLFGNVVGMAVALGAHHFGARRDDSVGAAIA